MNSEINYFTGLVVRQVLGIVLAGDLNKTEQQFNGNRLFAERALLVQYLSGITQKGSLHSTNLR